MLIGNVEQEDDGMSASVLPDQGGASYPSTERAMKNNVLTQLIGRGLSLRATKKSGISATIGSRS